MKPTIEARSTFSSSTESVAFGISLEDSSHVMDLLQDGLYTDKILAVLREYSANAWDAHRMIGKGDVPIQVQIPTRTEPVLKIRDFGPGLSHDDVFKVFSQYGRSTKRDTNEAVGSFGVGSKSGFAYSDMFTITSWHGGEQRTYVAVLDESVNGRRIDLLDTSDCDLADTGLEIMIVTRPDDTHEFQSTAQKLYQHFNPRPVINIQLPAKPAEQTVLKNGTIVASSNTYGAQWMAIMGCVPYRVNLEKLDQTQISKCLPNLSGSLFFEIGDVQVSASREELKYTTATKNALVQKLNDLVDEYVLHALEDLEKPGVSGWDKRLKLQVLTKLDLPLPENYVDMATMWAKISYAPGTFTLLHGGSVTTRLTISSDTRILIDDTGKTLANYSLKNDDYVARAEGKSVAEIRQMVTDALAASDLTGCRVELLSTVYYQTPYVKPKKIVNPKHKASMFTLRTDRSHFASPYSDNWELVTRVPEDTDVYVVIEGFQAYSAFSSELKEDRAILAYFGETMPVVYGYKNTEKKPAVGMKGKEYRVWRKEFMLSLLTPARRDLIQEYYWKNPGGSHSTPDKESLVKLESALGVNHPIVTALTRQLGKSIPGIVGSFAGRVEIYLHMSDASKCWSSIEASYPLLKDGDIRNLWYAYGTEPAAWQDYVRLVDERATRLAHLSSPVDSGQVMVTV